MILLNTNEEDLLKLEPILSTNPSFETPNIKLSIYKNRRGSYKGIYLWCHANLGICRIQPMFATTWNHELINIEDIKVIVEDEPTPWEKENKQ